MVRRRLMRRRSPLRLPSPVRRFLESTSIHGLRYVASSDLPRLLRLLWLSCVAVSFISAGCIVFQHLQQWKQTPGIVTGVSTVLVQVEETWMEEGNGTRPLPELGAPCELLRSLWALLVSHVGEDKYRFQSTGKAIARFLSDVSLGRELATADAFKRRVSSTLQTHKSFSELCAESDTTFPPPHVSNYNMFNPFAPVAALSFGGMVPYERLLYLYSYFFPVIDSEGAGVLPLRGLSDILDSAVDPEPAELGPFFLKAISAGGFDGFKEVNKQNLLADGLASLFGEHPEATARSGYLTSTLSSFTTQLATTGQYPCQDLFANMTSKPAKIRTVCEDEDKSDDCADYCKTARLNATWLEKVAWALEEASGEANRPDSQLPGCYLRGTGRAEGCWTRVINEKGVCYTSAKTSREVIISGGLSEALTFALDMSRTLSVYSARGRYSVAVTQQNKFTPSRYSPTVQTMLMPPSGKDYLHGDDEDEDAVADVTVRVLRHSTTTPDFAGIPPDTRRCFYPGEKALKRFPAYSQSNCMLECAWAAGAKAADCVPWYLREAQYEAAEMCEKHGLRIFDGIVAERNSMDDACARGCLPDCERIEYQIETKTVDGTLSKRVRDDLAMVHGLVNGARNTTERWGLSPALAALAEELLAAVNVLMSTDVALEIVTTAATTPLDAVASIGGTLGLFSGFSLISGVEALF